MVAKFLIKDGMRESGRFERFSLQLQATFSKVVHIWALENEGSIGVWGSGDIILGGRGFNHA
jgi:hypothetical protein